MSTTNQSERVSTKTEDFLDSDPAIRGQGYVCLSFISPEDVIIKKESHFFNKFLTQFSTDTQDLFARLIEKFKDDSETQDMFVNLQSRYDYLFSAEKLQEEFNFFKSSNSETLEKQYLEENKFQTSMRGIKVRGVYETVAEAQKRANMLKDIDGKFDVYVASVGCWCPWSPNPDEIQDQEYAETELNTLVKNYKDNLHKRNMFQQQRIDELKEKVHKQRDQPRVEVVELPEEQVPIPTPLDDTDPWLEAKKSVAPPEPSE